MRTYIFSFVVARHKWKVDEQLFSNIFAFSKNIFYPFVDVCCFLAFLFSFLFFFFNFIFCLVLLVELASFELRAMHWQANLLANWEHSAFPSVLHSMGGPKAKGNAKLLLLKQQN